MTVNSLPCETQNHKATPSLLVSSCLFMKTWTSPTYLLLLFSCSVMSGSLWPHRQQHTGHPILLLSPGACSNSCPLSRWCHSPISSFASPFSSCLQSFPASWSFPVSRLFPSGGQSIGASASASILPVNIQGWLPLGPTGLKYSSAIAAVINYPRPGGLKQHTFIIL